MKIEGSALLPTRYGKFRVFAFSDKGREHLALVKGNVKGKKRVLLRVHSQCITGDVFGSLRCDCREQLEKALKKIAKAKEGILLYLNQEGRGIGLANKIKAYSLQDMGYDTVDANIALSFPPDARDYKIAGSILHALGVNSVILLTNNPRKISEIGMNGVKIEGRLPLLAKTTRYNARYLNTKKEKLGHML